MDLDQLCSVLQACISPDPAAQKAGEQALKQSEVLNGQVVSLLRVAVEERVDPAVRQVAAISFKNLVKRHWEVAQGEAKGYIISDADKAMVRDNVLESLIRVPHAVQVQLGECLKTVVLCDYPERWPTLLPALTQNLQSNDPSRTSGALLALRMVVRKYQFSDAEDRIALGELIDATFPALLNLTQLINADTSGDLKLADAARQILKCFYYANYMEAAVQLLEPNTFMGWMGALHTMITKPVSETGMPIADDEGRRKWPWWKVKKWAFRVAYRQLSRYTTLKDLEGNELAFAKLYIEKVMSSFIEAMMGVMAQISRGQAVASHVTSLALQGLTIAVQSKACYQIMKPHADDLLLNVVFPLMCLNAEDARLWEEDPQEYIRRGYDFLENPYDVKMSAVNFAHQLCMRKKAPHMQHFMVFILNILNTFAVERAAGNVSAAAIQRMDGALMAIGSLANILHKKKPYKQQLEAMLMAHVAPCMEVPYGHLRAKACRVVGVFADIEVAGGEVGVKGPNFGHLFRAVVTALRDSELPVRVDAGASLRYFIDELPDGNALSPILPQLLDGIFTLMSEVDNEELVSSLETIIEKVGESIAPFAVELAQRLVTAYYQYSDKGEGDEDDDSFQAEWAAYGCLRALNTLLGNLSELPHVFSALESAIFPLMRKLISTDGQDLLEEVLELLTYFTYISPSISQQLWSLWPQIHQVVVEWGVDYWEHILRPLDNYISRGTEVYLTSTAPDYQASVYQMVEKSLSTDISDETPLISAAQLLVVVLQNCRGRVDRYVEPYLALALRRLPTVQSRKLGDNLMLIVANGLYYNAALALAALQHHGAVGSLFTSWFQMIFAVKGDGEMKHFRFVHEKRMVALGLTALLALPDDQLPAELKAGLPQIASGAMHVLKALKQQLADATKESEMGADEADEDDSDDEADEGDDAVDDDVDEDPEYIDRLKKAAKDFLSDKKDDESDDDDDFDEFEDVTFPTDEVDVIQEFVATVTGLQAGNPSRYQALEVALQGGLASGVQLLLQPIS